MTLSYSVVCYVPANCPAIPISHTHTHTHTRARVRARSLDVSVVVDPVTAATAIAYTSRNPIQQCDNEDHLLCLPPGDTTGNRITEDQQEFRKGREP